MIYVPPQLEWKWFQNVKKILCDLEIQSFSKSSQNSDCLKMSSDQDRFSTEADICISKYPILQKELTNQLQKVSMLGSGIIPNRTIKM